MTEVTSLHGTTVAESVNAGLENPVPKPRTKNHGKERG
jgi:hypothetical protein